MADTNKDPAESQGGTSGLGRFLLPLFTVVNLIAIGGGAFLVYKATLGFDPPVLREPAAFEELMEERDREKISDPVLYTMTPFTVNLAGTPRRLIRVEMTFEMLDKEGFEEIVRNSAPVRDAIVRILNAKTFGEIETIQGKLFLKDQIAVTLNESLRAGVVKDIYFNEFLVQ